MVSCNEGSISNLLFNRISDGEKLYGHGGRGIIFADTEGIIDGNPQEKMSKLGDTLNFSAALETENYYDEAGTQPVLSYMFAIAASEGLAIDQSSIKVSVGNRIISESGFEVEPASPSTLKGTGLGEAYAIRLDWSNYTVDGANYSFDSFKYSDNAPIEVTYSAKVSDSAPATVFSRPAYAIDYLNGARKTTDSGVGNDYLRSSYQATAYINGNIEICRTDKKGEPVAGAKYTVDGVAAFKQNDRLYVYNETGSVSEFVTGNDGCLTIMGTPTGEYGVHEVFSPDGAPEKTTITKTVSWDNSNSKAIIAQDHFRFMGQDYSDMVVRFSDTVYGAIPFSDIELVYNPETGMYTNGATSYEYNGETLRQQDGIYYKVRTSEYYDGKFAVSSLKDAYESADYNPDDPNSDDVGLYFNDDGTVRFGSGLMIPQSTFSEPLTLREDGCYHGKINSAYYQTIESNDATLCQGPKGGYELLIPVYYMDEETHFGMHFTYSEKANRYLADFTMIVMGIKETDGGLLLSAYMGMEYYPEFDKYFMFPMFIMTTVEEKHWVTEKTIPAVRFEFATASDQSDDPEAIPNPQTSDTLTKAACIVLMATASAYIMNRKLSRR